MNLQGALTIIAEGWCETVAPALRKQRYEAAHNDLCNLSLASLAHAQEFARYHHGIAWMVHIKLLKDALQNRNETDIHKYTEKVQMYFAQLCLAAQTRNTF